MKKKILLITGGTGGHVIPAENLANYLTNLNIDCTLMVDKRGYKYINNFNGKISIVNSSNLNGSVLKKFFSIFILLIGFIKSFFIVLFLRPSKIISFGSYASFFPMLSCLLLKPFYQFDIFIHEQNSILGRTNKFFIFSTKKIFLNFDILQGINSKYKNKTYVVGSPEKNTNKSFISSKKNFNDLFTILIYGGSQGSEFISKFSVNLINLIEKERKIDARFIIQCPKKMIHKLSNDLNIIKSKIVIKDFFYNIDEILQNTSFAISRAGAGSITDLINYKIPSVLIPLPNSKDNHQFYNASIMAKENLSVIINQNKDEIIKAKKFIYEIYQNRHKSELINKSFSKIKVKNSNSLIYNLINYEK